MRKVLSLGIVLLALGCAGAPRPGLISFHGECRRSEEWLAQFAVRRAARVDSALVRAQHAGLVVQARSASGATDTVLTEAQIRIFRGESESQAALLATGAVNASGWYTVDAPALATAYVHARWFGYVPRGEVVRLRVGYRDTAIVHLRYDVVCLSS